MTAATAFITQQTLVRSEYASHILEQCLSLALGSASALERVSEEILANFEQRIGERSEEMSHVLGMTKVLRDVFDTRITQFTRYDSNHDDTHTNDELIRYACCVAYREPLYKFVNGSFSSLIPLERDDSTPDDVVMRPWKAIKAEDPDRRDVLIKAIGLMVAEVERIDRARVAEEANRRARAIIDRNTKERKQAKKAKKRSKK